MQTSGHLLKPKIARSKKWRRLDDDFHRLIYCLAVACVDSWGMLPADPLTLKSTLDTYCGFHEPADYLEAVKALGTVKLLAVWEHQGDLWLYVVGHDKEQSRGIHKRKNASDVPRPSWIEQGGMKIPQPSAGRPQPSAASPPVKGNEMNRKEGEGSPHIPAGDDPSAGPPDFDPHIYEPQFQVAMVAASELYQSLWGQKKPPVLSGDNLTRALEAWTLTDDNALIAAVHGHRIMAFKTDGERSQLGAAFRLVFPEARKEGERISHKLCCDRFMEFVEAGRHKLPDPVADAARELRKQEAEKQKAADDEETQALIKRAGAEGLKGKDLLDAIKKQIRKERES